MWPLHREEIRLWITNVVMPGGVNGLKLAQKLLAEQSTLRVIIISGYNTTVSDVRQLDNLNVKFIDKPFELGRLPTTVRVLIDAVGSPSG